MLGLFLLGSVAAALADGSVSSVDEYCNQHGCNYEDVFVRREVNDDDD